MVTKSEDYGNLNGQLQSWAEVKSLMDSLADVWSDRQADADYERRASGAGDMYEGKKDGIRIVHNKLLGGWFIVRGSSDTPISGRFDSREEAKQSLIDAKNRRDSKI